MGGAVNGWSNLAACAGLDLSTFYPAHTQGRGDAYAPARPICDACPVRRECLDDALAWEKGRRERRWGMAGGLSPDERHRLDLTTKAAS